MAEETSVAAEAEETVAEEAALPEVTTVEEVIARLRLTAPKDDVRLTVELGKPSYMVGYRVRARMRAMPARGLADAGLVAYV